MNFDVMLARTAYHIVGGNLPLCPILATSVGARLVTSARSLREALHEADTFAEANNRNVCAQCRAAVEELIGE